MGMKTTIRSIATFLLIALFTFSGVAKLMPFPSPEFHGEMVSVCSALIVFLRMPLGVKRHEQALLHG